MTGVPRISLQGNPARSRSPRASDQPSPRARPHRPAPGPRLHTSGRRPRPCRPARREAGRPADRRALSAPPPRRRDRPRPPSRASTTRRRPSRRSPTTSRSRPCSTACCCRWRCGSRPTDGCSSTRSRRGRSGSCAPDGTLQEEPFVTLKVAKRKEMGALGLALDPDFATNHWVYVFYSQSKGDTDDPDDNRIVRFTERDGLATERTVIIKELPTGICCHNGGRIGFGHGRQAVRDRRRRQPGRQGPESEATPRQDPAPQPGRRHPIRQSRARLARLRDRLPQPVSGWRSTRRPACRTSARTARSATTR